MTIQVEDDQVKLYLSCLKLAKSYYDGILNWCHVQIGDGGAEAIQKFRDDIATAQVKSDHISAEIDILSRSLAIGDKFRKRKVKKQREGKKK